MFPPSEFAPNASDNRQRLLDEAERLMAQHGIAGTSLRDVTDAAGVNVAMVKYYFGSKDDLVEATLRRRLEPINQKRIAELDEVEAAHPKGPLPLEAVLEALIRPVVELGLSGGEGGRTFLKLFGRIFAEPASAMHIIRKEMGRMIKRFDAAIARALPVVDEADMGWRKMAAMGVVQHTLLMLAMIDELPVHLRIPIKLMKGRPNPDQVLAQMVAFIAAGMRSKVSPS